MVSGVWGLGFRVKHRSAVHIRPDLHSQACKAPGLRGFVFEVEGLEEVIDSGLVGRKVSFIHHIRPVVKSHEERRCSILGPTQSRISPSILKYTKNESVWQKHA